MEVRKEQALAPQALVKQEASLDELVQLALRQPLGLV
jgi:hypothetical protein